MKNFSTLTEINNKVFELSAGIRLLGNVSWPAEAGANFLANYRKGKIKLPQITYQKISYQDQRKGLESLLKSFTANDPLETFTKKNIESYLSAIDLNDAIGTDEFTKLSIDIFGTPGDFLPGSRTTTVMAANQLVDLAMDFSSPFATAPKNEVSAEDIKSYMDRRVLGVFKGKGPEVVVVDNLAAKATASTRLIKLQAGANFTAYDFKQLFYHEVMTHSLTALNGEAQSILKTMGKGTLRSLKTQEGLATFSEVITGSMDIHRLKRLALRILAIEMALSGASFLDVFEFFLSKGQTDVESYEATHRVFRGGYPDKNIVFTKDCVYLEGLISVHTFFRWAMKHNRLEACHLLFCGRLSLEDVINLEEAYHYQWIAPPKYLPGWFAKIEGLAGSLGFSLLANLVRIDIADQDFYKVA